MDIWRCAIVRQPAAEILRVGIDAGAVTWLPDLASHCFRADPFGLWRDGRLHVFVEAFDYRVGIGRIEVLVHDRDLRLLETRVVLQRKWHLSYPFVFEAEGETWMLPEACASGTLTLYRAAPFPFAWEPVCDFALDAAAVDATPFLHRGRWWLFYAPFGSRAARRGRLHLAWSERVTGPWRPHPGNPVRIDLGAARPGGTPWTEDGAVVLPVQDNRAGYGGAIRELVITALDEAGFAATVRNRLAAPAWMTPFNQGLHTLASAGPVTLLDVKRRELTLGGAAARLARLFRQLR